MSRAKAIADAEADRVEAEEPDEPEVPAEVTEEEEALAEEEEQATPEPDSETLAKMRDELISAEDDRHEGTLREIYGDAWGDREVCPLCLQDGFVIPASPGEFDQERRYYVLQVMGDIGEPKLKHHPFMSRCEACGGAGKWETGSLVETYKTEQCDVCQGAGRIDNRNPAGNVVQFSAPPAQPWNEPQYAPPVPNSDQWGRPAGHPHWGQDPAAVGL